MILFSKKKGVTTSIKQGDFYCPNCDASQHFKMKRVRRYLSFYQIPLIPMEALGEYVECLACLDTYKPKVLEQRVELSPQEFQAEYHNAIKEIMIRILIADGRVDMNELDMLQNIYQRITRKTLEQDELEAEIVRLKNSQTTLEDALVRLQGNLNDHGKELVIRAAFYVAMSDGNFHENEQEFLAGVAENLGMTPAHFQGVISTA